MASRVAHGPVVPGSTASFTATLQSHQSGDRLIVFVGGKMATATIPTIDQGFVLIASGTGGTGTLGNDTGTVFWAVYGKDATSSSETSPTVTAGATAPDSWVCFTSTYRVSGILNDWADDIFNTTAYCLGGSDTATSGTTLAASYSLGITPATLGSVVGGYGVFPSDVGSLGGATFTITGTSGGTTTTTDGFTTNSLNNDCGGVAAAFSDFTGTQSGGATVSFTITGANNSSGAVVMLILRQTYYHPSKLLLLDGFEANNFNTWDGLVESGTGDASIVTSPVRQGTYSFSSASGSTAQGSSARIRKDFAANETKVEVGGYIYIPSSVTIGLRAASICAFRDSSGNHLFELLVGNSGTLTYVYRTNTGSTSSVGISSNYTIPRDTWTRWETQWDTSDGRGWVQIGGIQADQFDVANQNTAYIDDAVIGLGDSNANCTFYYDDLYVRSTIAIIRSGAASGAIGWAGTVTGANRGIVTGSIGWSGAVTGIIARHGSTAGAIGWVGSVTGKAPYRGAATGGVGWAGSVGGSRPPKATAAGAVGWVGGATGRRVAGGTAVGGTAYDGSPPTGSNFGPPLLSVTTLSDTELVVSWTAVDGALFYDVEQDGVVVARIPAPEVVHIAEGLDPATVYCYRVRAVIAGA